MKYRFLGNTGIQVSEISLGSWLTYGNVIDNKTAEDCFKEAIENGINFFDTADVYNNGGAAGPRQSVPTTPSPERCRCLPRSRRANCPRR